MEIAKKDLLRLIEMSGYYISDYETYTNGMIEERSLIQKLKSRLNITPFIIVYRCKSCKNISGKPPMVYGYLSEARENNCNHKLEKIRQFEDSSGRFKRVVKNGT